MLAVLPVARWGFSAVQAAFRRISNDVFEHLLELDLSFHVHRKTGQIMRILDRGTSSIQVGVGGQRRCTSHVERR